MANKVGRPDVYETKIKPYLIAISGMIARGNSEVDIQKELGVGRTAWNKYKREIPEFTNIVQISRKLADNALIGASFKRAMGYDVEETKTENIKQSGYPTITKVTTTNKHIPASENMIKFLLTNRIPEEFSENNTTVINNNYESNTASVFDKMKEFIGDGDDKNE